MGRAYRCDECSAIRRELDEAMEAERARSSGEPRDLRAWLERLDLDECARLRETSVIWKAWRKAVEHQLRTGHSILLAGASMGSAN
jgi:hypothetical protein